MTTFPSLDYTHIKARFPKSVDKIKEWLFNQQWMIELTGEEFGKFPISEEIKEHATGVIIQMDPRKLYDIFDQLQVFISIQYGDNSFRSFINAIKESKISGVSSTRIQAEQTAFEDAFETLEKILS